MLPVVISFSDDQDEEEDGVRQAPWLRPGGYRFVMVGTSRRIPAFHGDDEDDLTDQPWDMVYVDAAMVIWDGAV